jgi:hypothetical protein
MYIECTKKLFATIKIKPNDIVIIKREPFYEWHANLFTFARRKGIILMNNQTRYCIILYGVKAQHFKKLDSIVLASIKETFIAEGFLESTVDTYIANCGDVIYTKTHDRSILSHINDFLISISWNIEEYIPSDNINLVELNKVVGRFISGPTYPIDLLKMEMSKLEE